MNFKGWIHAGCRIISWNLLKPHCLPLPEKGIREVGKSSSRKIPLHLVYKCPSKDPPVDICPQGGQNPTALQTLPPGFISKNPNQPYQNHHFCGVTLLWGRHGPGPASAEVSSLPLQLYPCHSLLPPSSSSQFTPGTTPLASFPQQLLLPRIRITPKAPCGPTSSSLPPP